LKDWDYEPIEQYRYSNEEYPITGLTDHQGGSLLHPACVFEDELRATYDRVSDTHSAIRPWRRHIEMPTWRKDDLPTADDYGPIHRHPIPRTTTAVTVILVPQDRIGRAEMGFYFKGNKLPSLRERMRGERKSFYASENSREAVHFLGLVGNLGYTVTEDLIDGHRWSHNRRFAEAFHLPSTWSYIGFYLFRERGRIYSAFQGAHPAAVAVKGGKATIIPQLTITAYKVVLWGKELQVDSINPPLAQGDITLFTPAFPAPEKGYGDLPGYQPMVPTAEGDERVNVFVANEGNGRFPVEKAVKVWIGRAPLPSFGAVLSFDRAYFGRLFADVDTFRHLDQPVYVEPNPGGGPGTNLDAYEQVLGGFVPAVVDGQQILCAETVREVEVCLDEYGNANSAIARCGKETKNFDLRIREPAGLLVETEDQIGWVLFDGRHELSIGASVVDAAMILKKLGVEARQEALNGQEIIHAVFIDGGSAMKCYAVKSDRRSITLDLLNRVAPGARNRSGSDPDGLNLYTLLKLSLLAEGT
jgi:hypothetical protein